MSAGVDAVVEPLSPWLAERLGGGTVEIAGLRRHTEGWSWQTYTLDASWVDADGSDRSAGFAVRRQPEDGLLAPYDVAGQFALQRALAGAGLPVPRPLWLEPDPDVLGMPFYVMERAQGVVPTQTDAVFADDGVRRRLGEAFVDLLAQVHRVELGPLGDVLGAAPAPEDVPAVEVARWRRSYEENALTPVPPLESAFLWLDANLAGSGRVALCHGDYRIGNFMTDGRDRIVALFDWELAHLGDPAEDVAFAGLRLFRGRSPRFSHLLERGPFLARYAERSGLEITEDVLRFWTVLSYVKASTNYLRAARAYEAGGNPDLRLAQMGHQLLFLLKQLRDELR